MRMAGDSGFEGSFVAMATPLQPRIVHRDNPYSEEQRVFGTPGNLKGRNLKPWQCSFRSVQASNDRRKHLCIPCSDSVGWDYRLKCSGGVLHLCCVSAL